MRVGRGVHSMNWRMALGIEFQQVRNAPKHISPWLGVFLRWMMYNLWRSEGAEQGKMRGLRDESQ